MSNFEPCPFCGSDAIDVMAWENSTDDTKVIIVESPQMGSMVENV